MTDEDGRCGLPSEEAICHRSRQMPTHYSNTHGLILARVNAARYLQTYLAWLGLW